MLSPWLSPSLVRGFLSLGNAIPLTCDDPFCVLQSEDVQSMLTDDPSLLEDVRHAAMYRGRNVLKLAVSRHCADPSPPPSVTRACVRACVWAGERDMDGVCGRRRRGGGPRRLHCGT